MRIGVDLGGTKIEAIAIDEAGKELWRRRVSTPIHDYSAILSTIRNLVTQAENDLSQGGASELGHPGPYYDNWSAKKFKQHCLEWATIGSRPFEMLASTHFVSKTMRIASHSQKPPTAQPL